MNDSTGIRPVRAAAVLAALALAATACGTSTSGPSAGTSATPTPSASKDAEPVLQIRDGGGLLPASPARTPRLSLYEDGTLITSEGQSQLPAPRVAHLSRAEVRSVVQAARDAELTRGGTLGPNPPPDGPTTSYVFDGTLTTTRAPELRDCSSLRKLCALDTRLDALAEPSEPYAYTVLAAVFRESAPGRSSDAADWPLGKLSGAGDSTRAGRCLLTRGKDRERVEEAARTAKSGAWTDGTATYQVTLRPLLPGERDCADVVTS
ncbi:hypothetical protein ACFVYF_03670 [Streptomyces sp. NPDC058274]|uniref:hypothetical protein n=1 Tax=Streptomyces sp. NPDC058274 TaxID=3346416 RepID=UPI0036E9EC8E